jgi:hypothetical protein
VYTVLKVNSGADGYLEKSMQNSAEPNPYSSTCFLDLGLCICCRQHLRRLQHAKSMPNSLQETLPACWSHTVYATLKMNLAGSFFGLCCVSCCGCCLSTSPCQQLQLEPKPLGSHLSQQGRLVAGAVTLHPLLPTVDGGMSLDRHLF